MSNLNLSNKILPGVSAGGYTIGLKLSSYKELSSAIEINTTQKSIGQILSDSQGWMFYRRCSEDRNTLSETSYYYKDNIVRLVFNANQLLHAIYLADGYQGEVFDSIKIHSNLSDLEKIFDVEYDDCEEMYYPSNLSGISGIEFYLSKYLVDKSIQDREILMICIYNWDLG